MIEEDVKNATNNGLLVGVYHLAYPSTNTAESEAQHFVNVSKNYLQQGYLQPMLDIEQGECDKFADKSVLVQWIKDWMNSVRQKGGNDNIKPILYTGCCCADAMKSKDPAFINELLNEGRLWVARYPDSEEHNPSDNPPASYLSNPCMNVCNFDASKWGFWQWTDKMKVDGIPSNYVDEDIFNGNLSKLQTFIIPSVLSYKIYDDPDVDWEVMNITTPKGVESGDTIDIYKSRELIAKFDAGMKNICIYNKSEKYWANLEAHYREMYNGPSHYPVQSNPTIKTKGETLILSVNSSTDDDKIKAHYSFTIYPNGSIYINKTASVPNPVATDECLREDGNIGIHFGEFKADGKSYVKIYDNGTLFSWNLTNPSGFGDVDTSHTLENGDWISKTESGSNVTLIFRVDYTSGYDNEGKPSSLAAVVQYTPAHMGLMIGRKGVMMWHPTVLPAGEYITRGWISVEPTSVNNPPDPPLNLAQLKSDGTTEISVGGMTDERTVIIKGNVSDPDGDKIKLQVELRRLDEYDGTFLQRFTQESNLGSNGSQVGIPVYGLIDGDYHWQARTVDEYGLTSEWVDFGNNDISDADFTVSSPNQHPTASFTYSPQSPKAGEEVILDASNSYDPDGKIKLYEWDLDGDNEYEGFTTSSEIYYYWDKSGTYSVKLRVTDINGATNTIIQDINIEQNSWWDKLKKFFAPSVIRLSKSEKQRFEVIKRELHISNRNSSF